MVKHRSAEIGRSEVQFLVGLGIFTLSHTHGKTKKQLSLLPYRAQNLTSLLFHLEAFYWRIAHKETHTVSNPCHSFQFSTLSKLIGKCKLNFAVCKIWISKVGFFCRTYNANVQESNLFSRIDTDESGNRKWIGFKWRNLGNILQAELFKKSIFPRCCNVKNERDFPARFNLLTPMSDQDRISPYNIYTISIR